MQRQSKFACSPFFVSAFHPQMPGNVEDTRAPAGPVTLAQVVDSTPGQAADYMRDLGAVCTLVRAVDFMQGLAAECMLARGVAYIRVQEADSMLARGGESI
jgi:hypothetical protein